MPFAKYHALHTCICKLFPYSFSVVAMAILMRISLVIICFLGNQIIFHRFVDSNELTVHRDEDYFNVISHLDAKEVHYQAVIIFFSGYLQVYFVKICPLANITWDSRSSPHTIHIFLVNFGCFAENRFARFCFRHILCSMSMWIICINALFCKCC